jgi:cell division protein FtsB
MPAEASTASMTELAVGTAGGLLVTLGAVFAFLDRRKANTVEEYKRINDDLRTQHAAALIALTAHGQKLDDRCDRLAAENIKCHADHAAAMARMEFLTKWSERQDEQIAALKAGRVA